MGVRWITASVFAYSKTDMHSLIKPATIVKPSQTVEELFRRLEVTEEIRDWIYAHRPKYSPSFVILTTVQCSMPEGLTAEQIWNKTEGLHENLKTLRVLRRILQ